MPTKQRAIKVKVIHKKAKKGPAIPLGHTSCQWEPVVTLTQPVVTLTFKRRRPAKKK